MKDERHGKRRHGQADVRLRAAGDRLRLLRHDPAACAVPGLLVVPARGAGRGPAGSRSRPARVARHRAGGDRRRALPPQPVPDVGAAGGRSGPAEQRRRPGRRPSPDGDGGCLRARDPRRDGGGARRRQPGQNPDPGRGAETAGRRGAAPARVQGGVAGPVAGRVRGGSGGHRGVPGGPLGPLARSVPGRRPGGGRSAQLGGRGTAAGGWVGGGGWASSPSTPTT